jgi:hypothetical protein
LSVEGVSRFRAQPSFCQKRSGLIAICTWHFAMVCSCAVQCAVLRRNSPPKPNSNPVWERWVGVACLVWVCEFTISTHNSKSAIHTILNSNSQLNSQPQLSVWNGPKITAEDDLLSPTVANIHSAEAFVSSVQYCAFNMTCK